MIGNDWDEILKDEMNKDYFKELINFVNNEYKTKTIYPKKCDIFNAFRFTSYKDVKVVILGQDPYHGENQAEGLSFSVKNCVRKPPSLQNIFKEMVTDLNVPYPETNSLVPWSKEGVLLLNTVLTVEEKKPASHKDKGWEQFTDSVITKLNENTFFDKFISKDKNKSYYKNVYKSYKNIASQFESNRILNISGEYHYLYKCSECKTLDGFSKFKSRLFWIVCGYGERPTYALITSLEIILIFAIIYLFTGISIGGRLINYRLSWFSILEKKIILVDFLESLYFSLVTFTTVGYGDIIPTGTSIILSSIEMILGVTMVGIWTATLARKITR